MDTLSMVSQRMRLTSKLSRVAYSCRIDSGVLLGILSAVRYSEMRCLQRGKGFSA